MNKPLLELFELLPNEMINSIFSYFNYKDSENFIIAFPKYSIFFQNEFLNMIPQLPYSFQTKLRKQICSIDTKMLKMEKVMETITAFPNEKHVIYLGKIKPLGFRRIMDFMELNDFKFLKHSYRDTRQTFKNVSTEIRSELNYQENRNNLNNTVFDYMTVGQVKFPDQSKPTGVSTAKAVQGFFNERKGKLKNINGKHIKILFISEHFKEGIDLIDVPHLHIIDEPLTLDQKKQIIGRIVRRGSMAGFPYNNGWMANIYQYNIKMSNYTFENIQYWLEKTFQTDKGKIPTLFKKYAVDAFVNEDIHDFQISGKKSLITNDIILSLEQPNTNLRVAKYNKKVAETFSMFKEYVEKMENKCLDQKFEYSPQQNFVRHYFNEQSEIDTFLLWHAAGSGKTATAIATISSSFEQAGRNIIFVTRASLVKDVEKNLFGSQSAHLKFRNNPKMTKTEKNKYLGKNWVKPMSYNTFENILSDRQVSQNHVLREISNKAKRLLKAKTRGQHILENSFIVFDEVHKITSCQRHLILQKINFGSFIKKPKILLMSATPFLNSAVEMFILKLFKRSNSFIDTENLPLLIRLGKGKVSYFDPRKDRRLFPQARIINKNISIRIPDFLLFKKKLKNELENIEKSNLSKKEKKAANRRAKGREKHGLDSINEDVEYNHIFKTFKDVKYK